MPLLTPEQLARIRQILRDASTAVAVRTAGQPVPQQDLQRLVDEGWITQEQARNLILDSYEYGRLVAALPVQQRVTWPEFEAWTRRPPDLSEVEQEALQIAQARAGELCTGLGNRYDAELGSLVVEHDQALADRMRTTVRDATSRAIAERRTLGGLRSDLRRLTRDWGRDWDRIARTETHLTKEEGFWESTVKTHGREARMAKIPSPDACESCLALYLDDGKPAIHGAGWWAQQGVSNVGRKKAEWRGCLGGVHPNCLCKLCRCPDGMVFDEQWDLVPEEEPKEEELAASETAHPPGAGWEAIPRGRHGGFRRRHGTGWEYFYPLHGVVQHANPWMEKYGHLDLGKYPPVHISPAAVQIDVSGDVNAHAIMTWKDDKGRVQKNYTPGFHRRNAQEKWRRVKRLEGRQAAIQRRVDEIWQRKGSQRERDAALIVAIIARTGLRPGGEESAQGGHYGVSTLRGEHVTIEGDEVHFDFVGKEGVRNKAIIHDARIAAAVAERKKDGPLFGADDQDARNLLQRLAPGVKLKDFRTHVASTLASKMLQEIKPPPPLPGDEKKAKRLIKAVIKQVSDAVAARLNNTPSVAKGSYIHPAILDRWLNGIGAEALAKSEDQDRDGEVGDQDVEWYPWPEKWRKVLEEDESPAAQELLHRAEQVEQRSDWLTRESIDNARKWMEPAESDWRPPLFQFPKEMVEELADVAGRHDVPSYAKPVLEYPEEDRRDFLEPFLAATEEAKEAIYDDAARDHWTPPK